MTCVVQARRCDGYVTLRPFAHRAARDADVLVLGLGHHFPGSLDWARIHGHAWCPPTPCTFHSVHCGSGAPHVRRIQARINGRAPDGIPAKQARIGFFSSNLNHTLASLLSARAALGRRDASRVILAGTRATHGALPHHTPSLGALC